MNCHQGAERSRQQAWLRWAAMEPQGSCRGQKAERCHTGCCDSAQGNLKDIWEILYHWDRGQTDFIIARAPGGEGGPEHRSISRARAHFTNCKVLYWEVYESMRRTVFHLHLGYLDALDAQLTRGRRGGIRGRSP